MQHRICYYFIVFTINCDWIGATKKRKTRHSYRATSFNSNHIFYGLYSVSCLSEYALCKHFAISFCSHASDLFMPNREWTVTRKGTFPMLIAIKCYPWASNCHFWIIFSHLQCNTMQMVDSYRIADIWSNCSIFFSLTNAINSIVIRWISNYEQHDENHSFHDHKLFNIFKWPRWKWFSCLFYSKTTK